MKLTRNLVFSLLAGAGVVATGALAAWAAPKVEREKTSAALPNPAYPYRHYIPAVLTGAGTILCIGSNCWLTARYEKLLLGAAVSAGQVLESYAGKVKETYGPEVHEKFMAEVRAERPEAVEIWADGLCGCSDLNFAGLNYPDRKRTFYELYGGRYFVSTIERVLQAEYHLNRNYALGGAVTLNDFYRFLGLEPLRGGDSLVWDMSDGIDWVDFDHRVTKLDGKDILEIEMVFEPERIEETNDA